MGKKEGRNLYTKVISIGPFCLQFVVMSRQQRVQPLFPLFLVGVVALPLKVFCKELPENGGCGPVLHERCSLEQIGLRFQQAYLHGYGCLPGLHAVADCVINRSGTGTGFQPLLYSPLPGYRIAAPQ